MQLNSGDLRALKDAHLTFGIPPPPRLLLEDDKIYFYNFEKMYFAECPIILRGSVGLLSGGLRAGLEEPAEAPRTRRALEELDEDEIRLKSPSGERLAFDVVLAALTPRGVRSSP